MKMKKEKLAVDGEPFSEMTEVKGEPIVSNDVICLSDNSNFDECTDDSTDPSDSTDSTDSDMDSSDSKNLKVVINDSKTQFSINFPAKMSMKGLERMSSKIQLIVRRNKISNLSRVINFNVKKKKKIIRTEKKTPRKNKKTDITKSTNKCNSSDKTEPKIEPKIEPNLEIVQDTVIQPNLPVWVKPPTPQPENLNSAQPLELSNLKDNIISSDCNNEAFLFANVDTNRIKIATNSSTSFRRYEDLNNGDLDYIEETMDLNLAIAEESTPKNSLKDTELFFGLSAQNFSQSPMRMIDNSSFKQEIKNEPELIIPEDEEVFRGIENIPNIPAIEKIKREPLKVDTNFTKLKVADQMINNTALIDSEQLLRKNELVKEKTISSKDEIMILSDAEVQKKLIMESTCKKIIETEKTKNNSENILNYRMNLAKDAELSDSSDDDLKLETWKNELLEEISMLSTDEETAHKFVKEDSANSPKKRNFDETLLCNDFSDYAAKNSVARKKLRTKISRIESDNEMESTDDESTFGKLRENQSNESSIKTDCRKVFLENNKDSDQKEIYARPKSRQEMKPLDEKISHDEKKLHCNKRSHVGAFDEETSSVKTRRNDEKFADKKKSNHENIIREKSGGEKNCTKEKPEAERILKKEKSQVEKICSKEKSQVEKICSKEKSVAEKILKKEKLQVEKSCKEKSKEEIYNRLNKSEHKVKTHKNDAKRRHSSEAKSPRVSENNNNINENSNCTRSAVNRQLMPDETPIVLLTKLYNQIQNSTPSESVNPTKNKINIKNVTKPATKQEAQTSSTKSIDFQDNQRKIPTPETKCSASKSSTKLNRNLTLKSKTETKIDVDISKPSAEEVASISSLKSVDSLGNKRKVSTLESTYSASKTENKYDLDNTKSSIKQDAQTASTKSIDSLDKKRKVSTPELKHSASKTEIKYDLDNLKPTTKQEPQTPSTKKLDSVDNKHKVCGPESKYVASQLMKKFNSDCTLKSETEPKHDPEKDQQHHKRADDVSIDELNTNKNEQHEGGSFNEVTMKIFIGESQKKVEEIQTFAMNTGVTIVKLQMTMEARSNHENEVPGKIAKHSVELQQMPSVDKHFGERENLNQCSEEKERKEKSAKLAKEMAVNEKISPADYEKFANVKTEKRKSLDSDNKVSFTDEKATSVKKNDLSKVNAETRKSLDAQNEFVRKSGMNTESTEKISSGKKKFPYDVEKKPMTSFVGRIPKKIACQSNNSPIGITPNCPENNIVQTSNEGSITSEGKSPNAIMSLSKDIMNSALRIVKGTQQHTQKIPSLLPNYPPKLPHTLSQFVQQILHWEPSWFKGNNRNMIRKVVGENYTGMNPKYESYDNFCQDAGSFLALKILDPLTSVPKKCYFKYSIVKGSIRPKKIRSTDVKMTTLKLDILIPRKVSLKEIYPLDGDLICFNYLSTDKLTKFTVKNEVFAIIQKVRSEIISERTIIDSNLRHVVHNPHELRTYTVMTKCIHDEKIHVKKVQTMTMIPESHRNLQNFLALKKLLYSPLLQHIMHPKVEDYQLPAVFTKYYPLVTRDILDAQQLDAVAMITEAATRRDPKICLLQGPPGTGKTKVVINIVRQLIHHNEKFDKNLPFRILVCAPSNSAVDEIAMRLLGERQKIAKDNKGERFRMVRVGYYGDINPKVKEISLEDLTQKEFDRFNDAVMKYDYEKIRKSIQFYSEQDYELKVQKAGAKWSGARNHFTRKLEDNKARWNFLKNRKFGMDNQLDEEEIKTLYKAAESTVLERAQVIVCNLECSTWNCMESVFGGTENGFSTCIIDESTKSSEVETLLPLSLGVKTLVLVGDTIQQPHSASIMPGQTKLHGLDRSLFARVRQAFAEESENPIIQFEAQYRMAYPVAFWPQQYFYSGNLHNCANLRCLPLHRYKVMNLDFAQEDNEGIMNEHEGVFVASLVMILMTRAGLDTFEHPVRISVITPYNRQKIFIYNKIKHIMDRLPIKLKEKIIVDVHTIDGIQGQERDIIIMSCVTTNGTRLLSDKQKLCMALTRAKNSLILCGNFRTYWEDTMWENLLKEAQSRQFYVNVPRYTHEDDIVAHILR